MARIIVPPKNNIYTLMVVLTTVIFVIGLVINSMKLSKDYKSVTAAKRPRDFMPAEVSPAVNTDVDGDRDDGSLDIN